MGVVYAMGEPSLAVVSVFAGGWSAKREEETPLVAGEGVGSENGFELAVVGELKVMMGERSDLKDLEDWVWPSSSTVVPPPPVPAAWLGERGGCRNEKDSDGLTDIGKTLRCGDSPLFPLPVDAVSKVSGVNELLYLSLAGSGSSNVINVVLFTKTAVAGELEGDGWVPESGRVRLG
jgi:hypothetical protein